MHLKLHSMRQIQSLATAKSRSAKDFSVESAELSLLFPKGSHRQQFLQQNHTKKQNDER